MLRAQAEYTNATLQAHRSEELVKTSAASEAERDRRVAAQQASQGEVVTADANLRTAKINLGYTEITAPIGGIAGKTRVTKGNLVGPDTGMLTTIVSQDPMYVAFPVSQREFLKVRRSELQANDRKVQATIRFSDGSAYDKPAVIDFLDVMVDRSTDTVLVRATVPNPEGALIDGQLVRVTVQGDRPEEKVLVPQTALLADQQGTYLFVAQDGKAEIRRVKVGGEKGADAVLDSGLSGGEQVIVQGMESLRAGAAVSATPVPPADKSELIRCSPASSSSGRGSRPLSPSSRRSLGSCRIFVIPIAQYPDIVPPQVSVTTTYPAPPRPWWRRRSRSRSRARSSAWTRPST